MSWMSLYDMKRAIEHILVTPTIVGPVNFAAPNQVRNEEFTRILGKVLQRPTFMWVPTFVLNAGSYVVGDFFENTLLASVRIQPKKLLDNGFKFEDTDLESTLSKMLL
jgi:NAD dependent epimerase/dehydratase family enzyme